MPTISKDVPRGDFLIHRGTDERLGVRWEQDKMDGEGYRPVDMSNWAGQLSLSHNGELLFSIPCTCTSDGLAIASLSAADTERIDPWRTGEWRIDATGPDGQRELMGWGYFEVV